MAFSKLESIQRHQELAIAFIVSELPEMFAGKMLDADAESESPIEAIFSLWWAALGFVDFMCVRELDLEAQYNQWIGEHNYRLDFAITPKDKDLWSHAHDAGFKYQRIGIELDGHDFHERTKEQVALRNRRDRDLQNNGWRVFHFSGSEIHRDPLAHVREAAIAASDALNDIRTQYYVHKFTSRQKS